MRVLIPMKTAEGAAARLSALEPLLRRLDAEVVILSAVPLSEPLEEVELGFSETLRRLRDRGFEAQAVARGGAAVQVILDTAEAEKVDLIVMTVRNRGMVLDWLSGQITEHVARETTRPLLVMPWGEDAPKPTAPDSPERIRELLVILDGDYQHQGAIPVAAKLAKLLEAKITILHDLEESHYDPLADPDGAKLRAIRVFEHASEALAGTGVEFTTETFAADDPVATTNERACSADLIVIGTHGRTGLARWIVGSVTERLLKTTQTPVVVVPADASHLAPSELTPMAAE